MRLAVVACWILALLSFGAVASGGDGNRLTYLDEFSDPYYVGLHTPKLVTPQWVGEDGVQAVIVLSLNDPAMVRPPDKNILSRVEAFLRPILERLKKIDGRAPLSMMSTRLDPDEPQWQRWLAEGSSVEGHTLSHPCPCLRHHDFAAAKVEYDGCVDQLMALPTNRPVAFRMPCCDGHNTVSPRFYAEIFNRTTPAGNFLPMSSSVAQVFTADDPALPRELVLDEEGRERFAKYVPANHDFINTIENYPYPYVVGRLCWEVPFELLSDWAAKNLHKAHNPLTVRDMKAGVDAAVIKRGVHTLLFHPMGDIRSEQIVEVIDHADGKYGKKIRFLTYPEVHDRLTENLLAGQPLRNPKGQDNGVRLLDLDNDGYMDVVIGNGRVRQTRVWSPKTGKWTTAELPVEIVAADAQGNSHDAGVRFGVLQANGYASILVRNEKEAGVWHFDGQKWVQDRNGLNGLDDVYTCSGGRDRGVRLRDLDGDGTCELVIGNEKQQGAFRWSPDRHTWTRLPFALPEGTAIVDARGRDAGLRFVDVDEDSHADVIFSDASRYSVHLFTSITEGWSRQTRTGSRKDADALPMIVRADGTNNGAWFKDRHMWVQNEDTGNQKSGSDNLDARYFTNDFVFNEVEPPRRTPRESLASLKPRRGFKVELVVAEPLVMDPIDVAWGADGKLWVVEMPDYPLGMSEDGHLGLPVPPGIPGGRIRFLEDTDGDGRYDKSTVFLESIGFPTGVKPWRKGVMVTAAPEVFYAEDTDGDGRADFRKPLFTGFNIRHSQLLVNHPRWGLDNWVYMANGWSGGKIRSVKTGEITDINGRDLRVRVDEGLVDAQTGPAQYGRDRDDWGNWFGLNNAQPGWHNVLADHYLRRNPHFAAPPARLDVTPDRDVYPIGRVLSYWSQAPPPLPEGEPGFWTALCGLMVYRDDLFGPAYAGNLFMCDSIFNVLHRKILTPNGVTFHGERALDEQKSEFLISSDVWFRPSNAHTAPDGTIWVVDMSRRCINHPEYIDDELEKTLDLRLGHDQGRIYRVYPVHKKPRPIPRLDHLDVAGLVAALDSPSGWQRDTAQQLLVWRADDVAVRPLEEMVTSHNRALARLHALCTLDGLKALRPEILVQALSDEHPGVRRHAVRLAESLASSEPELGAAMLKLADDPDPQVRMQLAYSLGEWNDPRAGRVLGELTVRHANDPYLSAAMMSSAVPHLEQMIAGVLPDPSKAADRSELVGDLLNLASALKNEKAAARVLATITVQPPAGYADWQYATMAQWLERLARRNTPLARLAAGAGPDLQAALRSTSQLFTDARALVAEESAAMDRRVAAMQILGRGVDRQEEDLNLLAAMLIPQTPIDLQLAVVDCMARLPHRQVPELLLEGWSGHGPRVRSAVLDVVMSREAWIGILLDKIEARADIARVLDTPRRDRLLRHRSKAIKQRAAGLLGEVTTNEQILERLKKYQPVLDMRGDPERGKKIFVEATCANCHRHGGVGTEVGPDPSTLTDKSPEVLLVAVIDPNRAFFQRFVEYTAVTTDGLIKLGLLSEETSSSITLVDTAGKPHVVLRTDLDELVSMNRSHMPEGLEAKLDFQQMADLFAFIAKAGPSPKSAPK